MVNFDIVTDVIMLLAAIIGLLGSLFRYVEIPKRGWFYASMFRNLNIPEQTAK